MSFHITRIAISFFCVFIGISFAYGTNYYFSSSTGNDANNGTSSATPWQTMSKANNFMSIYAALHGLPVLHPGDSVLFKRGDTWYGYFNWEILGDSTGVASPVVVGAYGSGAKPMIDGDVAKGGLFTAVPGRMGIYSAALNGTEYEFWGYCHNAPARTDGWHFLAIDQQPSSPNKRSAWLDTLSTFVCAEQSDSAWLKANYSSMDSIMVVPFSNFLSGQNFMVRDLQFQNNFIGIQITKAAGTIVTPTTDVILRNISVRYCGSIAIKILDGNSNIRVDSSRVDTVSFTPLDVYLSNHCVYSHDTVNSVQDSVWWGGRPDLVHNGMHFTGEYCGMGDQASLTFGYGPGYGNKFEYCVVSNILNSGWDSFFDDRDTVQYNTFTNSPNSVSAVMSPLGKGLVIRGNTINWNNGINFSAYEAGSNSVTGNTITTSGYDMQVDGTYDSAGTSVNISNNTFTNTSTTNYFEIFNSKYVTSTNNTFIGAHARWYNGKLGQGSTYTTLEGFQAATGYELGSIYYSSPAAPTGTFIATPDSLPQAGGADTLQWTSPNAISASISYKIGSIDTIINVNTNGTKVINVTSSTTFTLTLVGTFGTTVLNAHVTVGTTPTGYFLSQNFPNPFNAGTTIGFGLPKDENVTLKVYDILGREITTIFEGTKASGAYRVQWNPKGLASGVYRYRLTAGSYSKTMRMVIVH